MSKFFENLLTVFDRVPTLASLVFASISILLLGILIPYTLFVVVTMLGLYGVFAVFIIALIVSAVVVGMGWDL